MRFQFVASEIAIGLRRNLTMTIAVIITTAVSLSLVASAMLMRNQVGIMKGFWTTSAGVTPPVHLGLDVCCCSKHRMDRLGSDAGKR